MGIYTFRAGAQDRFPAAKAENICDYSTRHYPAPLQLAWLFVVTHYFLYIFPMVLPLFCVYYGCDNTTTGILLCAGIVAAYMVSFFNGDQFKGSGRPWRWASSHPLWHLAQSYAQAEIVREGPEFSKDRQYIYGLYPHGILILSRVMLYGEAWDSLFPNMRMPLSLGASPMFYCPGGRELCLWMGAVDASKKTAKRVLAKKNNLIVYPGGSAEIFKTDPNSPVTGLVTRTGFIRLALESGCDLVPTFTFGEKWMYNRWVPPQVVTDFFMRTIKTPLLLFWGRFCTWIPLRRHLTTVFGRPIRVEKCEAPTDEQVEELYTKFHQVCVCVCSASLFVCNESMHGLSSRLYLRVPIV